MKTKHFTKSLRVLFDLEKLKDSNIAELFRAKVGGKFAALCVLDSDVDTLANSLKEVLLSTAEKVLERQRKKDSTLGHKRSSGSVRPKTAADTTEVHKHKH